ncbi:MAG TPA: hypothetical protein VF457_13430, partial [Burkholderiaceae bacterium]
DGEAAGAVARHGGRRQPVCCLLPVSLADGLAAWLDAGQRRVQDWLLRHARPVDFDRPDDAGAFDNLNTPEDFAR